MCNWNDYYGKNLPNVTYFGELCEDTPEWMNKAAEGIVKIVLAVNKYCYTGDYYQGGEYGSFLFTDENDNIYFWAVSKHRFAQIMADVWNILEHRKVFKRTLYVSDDFINNSFFGKSEKVPKSDMEFKENIDTWSLETIKCTRCGKEINWEEFVINFEICDECFDSLGKLE